MSCWHTVKNILILNLYGTYFHIVFCLQNEESIFLKPFIKVPIFPHCFKRDLCIYRNLVYLEFLGQCPSVSVCVYMQVWHTHVYTHICSHCLFQNPVFHSTDWDIYIYNVCCHYKTNFLSSDNWKSNQL